MPEAFEHSRKYKYSGAMHDAMNIELRKLDPRDLEDRVNIFQYESPGHYQVDICETAKGWDISLRKEDFPQTFIKKEPEAVITHYKGDSEIYAAFAEGREVGLIQLEFQKYSGSLRVWDIDVVPEFRGMGVGKALMDLCKSRASDLGARRIVLETQTSNLKAIAFYRKMGFKLVGLDASHYTNDDIEKGEVRLEMAIHLGYPK